MAPTRMNLSAQIGPEPFSILNHVIKAATASAGDFRGSPAKTCRFQVVLQVLTPIRGQKLSSFGRQRARETFATTRRG